MNFPKSALILATILLNLSACHKKIPEENMQTNSNPGVMISGGRLVLPAVQGNPAAAYFTVSNDNAFPTTLISVKVVGVEKAEMHDNIGNSMTPITSLKLDQGKRVLFAPGSKHVMLFGLSDRLKAGGNTEITLFFQDGKTTNSALRIESLTDMTSAIMPANHTMFADSSMSANTATPPESQAHQH